MMLLVCKIGFSQRCEATKKQLAIRQTGGILRFGGKIRMFDSFLIRQDSLENVEPVSYTHLDVYKRQMFNAELKVTRPGAQPPVGFLAPGQQPKGMQSGAAEEDDDVQKLSLIHI